MKKFLSKFKVLVPMLVCVLALTMVLFTGCGETHTHVMDYIAEYKATCSELGTKAHYHCKNCGKDYSDKEGEHELSAEDMKIEIDSNAHSYVYDYVRGDGTAITTAKYGNYHCEHCNAAGTQEDIQAGSEEGYPFLVTNLEDLQAVVGAGGYAKLTDDIEVGNKLIVEQKPVSLDLNNKVITFNAQAKNDVLFDAVGQSFSLQNGTLKYEGDLDTILIYTHSSSAEKKAQLALNDVRLESKGGRGIKVYNDSTVSIEKSIIKTNLAAIGGHNQNGPTVENGIIVSIKESQITSTGACGVFMPSLMNVAITEGSKVQGLTSAVYAMMGTLNVDATSTLACTGTTFTAKTPGELGGTGYPDVSEFGGLDETGEYVSPKDGAAIVIRSNCYYNMSTSSTYAVGNTLGLNIENWNNVTAVSGVKAAVYNWTYESGYIAAAKAQEKTNLGSTDQFAEIVVKLTTIEGIRDVDGVRYFECSDPDASDDNKPTKVTEVVLDTCVWMETVQGEGGQPDTSSYHYYVEIREKEKEKDDGQGSIYEVFVPLSTETTQFSANRGTYSIGENGQMTMTFDEESKTFNIAEVENKKTLIEVDNANTDA